MKYPFSIILIVEFIIGSLINGFIVLVNCMDWVRRRKISSVDQILTALAISRIVLLWLVVTSILLSLHRSVKVTSKMVRMINIFWIVTNHFNLWLSTNLSIFYVLKIIHFPNSVFLYLKRRVMKVVSVTLLLSLVLLLVNIVEINTQIDVWVDLSKRNLSYNSSSRKSAQVSKLTLTNTLFTCIPFTVSLKAFLLLIISLRKHHKKVQRNAQGCRDPSTTAHVRALKTMFAFLLIYTIFLFSNLMQIHIFELLDKRVVIFTGMTVGLAFPLGHSCILIFGNHKLRQAALLVLWWLMLRAKHTGPCTP
uniref:taste receptor type 2 member 140-like n=1 Tax=Jaculus jaculus TaxID=51337 RepID=UPI001E1B0E03|nr:taste receptor type 2 member 140-like [Jaculus jaculus]